MCCHEVQVSNWCAMLETTTSDKLYYVGKFNTELSSVAVFDVPLVVSNVNATVRRIDRVTSLDCFRYFIENNQRSTLKSVESLQE